MILFDAVQLAQFVKLCDQGVNDLHTFEQFRAAFLVTALLLTLSTIEFLLKIGDLILKSNLVSLLGSQFHNFLTQLMQQGILVSLSNHLVLAG